MASANGMACSQIFVLPFSNGVTLGKYLNPFLSEKNKVNNSTYLRVFIQIE